MYKLTHNKLLTLAIDKRRVEFFINKNVLKIFLFHVKNQKIFWHDGNLFANLISC